MMEKVMNAYQKRKELFISEVGKVFVSEALVIQISTFSSNELIEWVILDATHSFPSFIFNTLFC